MKKLLLSSVIILLVLTLAACNANSTQKTSKAPSQKETTEQATTKQVTKTSDKLDKIKLSYSARTASFLPAQVAIEQQYFAGEGLDVEFIQMKTDVTVAALESGDIDYTLTFGSILEAILKGMKFNILMAVTEKAPQFLITQPEIKSVADLKGKTLGSGKVGGSGDLAAKGIIDGKGGQSALVKSIAIGDGPILAEALRQKTIDAASIPPPWPLLLQKEGFNLLGGPKDSKYSAPTATITASDATISKNPEQVKHVLKAMLKALQFVHNNQNEAATIMAKWLEQDLNSAKESMELLVQTYSEKGLLDAKTMQSLIDERKKTSEIDSNLTVKDVFDFTLLQQVQ